MVKLKKVGRILNIIQNAFVTLNKETQLRRCFFQF